MCRAGSSADAHTWPLAGHARRVLPQAFYALIESWNSSGRRSRHPAPPRMKKRRAEPPRDQPGANNHASCSPAERRQEMAGARPTAMAKLHLLYVLVSRSRRRPQEMARRARPATMAEDSSSSRSRRGDTSHASPCLAERRHEKAAGARPAAMSKRSWSSRSRWRLPCVPASGRAEAVDGRRSSVGRHGRELLDTPTSLPRAVERQLRRRLEPCVRRRGGWISPGSSGSQRHTPPFPGRADPRQRPIEGGDKVKVTARG
jgi:hypothetical protein